MAILWYRDIIDKNLFLPYINTDASFLIENGIPVIYDSGLNRGDVVNLIKEILLFDKYINIYTYDEFNTIGFDRYLFYITEDITDTSQGLIQINPFNNKPIRNITLFLGNKCNQKCYYCPYSKFTRVNKLLLDRGTISFILSFLAKYGIESINITGGETSLYSDTIFELISRFNGSISLHTNGSDINFVNNLPSDINIKLHCIIDFNDNFILTSTNEQIRYNELESFIQQYRRFNLLEIVITNRNIKYFNFINSIVKKYNTRYFLQVDREGFVMLNAVDFAELDIDIIIDNVRSNIINDILLGNNVFLDVQKRKIGAAINVFNKHNYYKYIE